MMTPGDIDKLQKECDFEYMKENSIEEDIKKAEELIKKCDKCKLTECINCEISWTEIASIRRIIDNYRNILKENEEYSKQLDLDYVDKNYISKKKIEDTIEELKGKLEDISKRREKSKTKEEETVLWCLEIRTDERIKTLQELL